MKATCCPLTAYLPSQGPASDKFGRCITYFVSGALFIATSIVCIFAPNIGILVAFRALQGAAGK